MKMTRKNKTIGALSRLHERNAMFGPGSSWTGPAVAPSGARNDAGALRYGTYPQASLPFRWKIWRGVYVLFGAGVTRYCASSDFLFSSVFLGRAAIAWGDV